MIREIGLEVSALLAARGCPFAVVDGPEQAQAAHFVPERIVFEHDPNGGDTFSAPTSQRTNAHNAFNQAFAVRATIYAQAGDGAATVWEHRRRALHALDMFVGALREVCMSRKNPLTLTGGRFTLPDDLAASMAHAGAVYELRLSVVRGVPVAPTWTEPSRPTATAGGDFAITSTTSATTPGNSAPAETGCGG